jgi:hypothetical protein
MSGSMRRRHSIDLMDQYTLHSIISRSVWESVRKRSHAPCRHPWRPADTTLRVASCCQVPGGRDAAAHRAGSPRGL